MTVTLLGLVTPARAPEAPPPTFQPSARASAANPDLLGNDVRPAVATYTFDPAGILYEEHSPETELPRLGEPQS